MKIDKFLADEQPPKPLLENGDCGNEKLACSDGTCLPAHYFCDGSVDCPDGSDEGWCGKIRDTYSNFIIKLYNFLKKKLAYQIQLGHKNMLH